MNRSVWTVRLVDEHGETRAESRLGRAGLVFIISISVLVAALGLALLFWFPSGLEESREIDDQLTQIRIRSEGLAASVMSVLSAAEMLSVIGLDPIASDAPTDSVLSFHHLGGATASAEAGRAAGALALLSSQLKSRSTDLQAIQGAHEGLQDVLKSVPNLWPVQSGLGKVSFEFGPAIHPFTETWYMHRGIDIAARHGLRVLAMARGTVTKVTRDTNSFGLQVVVQHEYGFETRYAHLADALVSRGDVVEAGGVVGTLGNSGLVTGPALHLEILIGGELVDPVVFLKMTNEFDRRTVRRGL